MVCDETLSRVYGELRKQNDFERKKVQGRGVFIRYSNMSLTVLGFFVFGVVNYHELEKFIYNTESNIDLDVCD